MTKTLTILILAILLLNCKYRNNETASYYQNPTQKNESYQRGKAVYQDMCVTCHLANGKGVEKVFPPLAHSDYLKNNQEESIKAIKYGLSDKITVNGIVYNSVMQPMGLTDQEVADVMNYINNTWGNSNNTNLTPEMVSNIKK